MKLKRTFYIGIAILTLSACSANQAEVSSFEECVTAGNLVMESYPRQCQHEGQTFVEEVEILDPSFPPPIEPSGKEGAQEPCTREFQPVCGEVQVQCFTTPCPPIKTTFENRCLAENEGAKNIMDGACVDEEPNPKGSCLSFDGNWIEETQECEWMPQEMCDNLGGEYKECSSACRNEPEAENCTLECVQVCQF